jgi:hypothetical protein
MPMPRRFVVVSAVGLADCVGIGGPLYNHVFNCMFWQCECLRIVYKYSCHVILGIPAMSVGVGERGRGRNRLYLYTPISVSSVTEGGRFAFGTTVRTRAHLGWSLDDESKVDNSAVNPH